MDVAIERREVEWREAVLRCVDAYGNAAPAGRDVVELALYGDDAARPHRGTTCTVDLSSNT